MVYAFKWTTQGAFRFRFFVHVARPGVGTSNKEQTPGTDEGILHLMDDLVRLDVLSLHLTAAANALGDKIKAASRAR